MAIDFPPSEDMEPEGSNRLFVILAVGLAGLIVLGLVAIGGVLILRNIRNQQALAQITPEATPTLSVMQELPTPTFTPTPTHTPLPPLPTEEPTATPTNTPVVLPTNTPTQDEAAAATAQAPTPTPTDTPVPVGTPIGGSGEVPDTGAGEVGLIALALGLVGVLFISRRMRQAM